MTLRNVAPVVLWSIFSACSAEPAGPAALAATPAKAGGACSAAVPCAGGLVCKQGVCATISARFGGDAGKTDATSPDGATADGVATDGALADAAADVGADAATADGTKTDAGAALDSVDASKVDAGPDVASKPDGNSKDAGDANDAADSVDAVDAFAAKDVALCQPKCNGVGCDDGCGGSFCVGKYCNDSNACTEMEMCGPGGCKGDTVNCEDGNACTNDSCAAASGCVNSNNAASCDDGNLCTSGDKCQNSACKAGTATVCSSTAACTTAVCAPLSGLCQTKNAKNGTDCDDGNLCTSGDICSSGSCAGSAMACDDGDACTLDSCDKSSGCSHVADAGLCNANDVATGNWRVSGVQASGTFTTILALVQKSGGTALSGNAIDVYGLATSSGNYVASGGNITFSKSYYDGTSAKSVFNYTGKLSGDSMSGSWSSNDGKVSGTFSAARQKAIVAAVAAGAWKLNASWGAATFSLSVTPEGYLTGTMSDQADSGTSGLVGVVDLGNGSIFFRKLYSSGTTWWYLGSMDASGAAMTGGTWGSDGETLTSGTWSAGR